MDHLRLCLLGALTLGLLSAGCAAGGSTLPPGSCETSEDCVDDGVFCNGTPVCSAGLCVVGTSPSCNDGIECTVDTCNPTADACQNVPDDTRCLDGDTCDLERDCVASTFCETDGECLDDGMFCNGTESCVDSMCTSGGRSCDDGDSCTLDSCDEEGDACNSVAADHLNDPRACGVTGANDCIVCPAPNALQVNTAASCEAGGCTLVCTGLFSDSDGDLSNGCECEANAGVDEPDERFEDTNCDGVDGDRDNAILVSISQGNDTPSCGLATRTPCRTIPHAMIRSIEASRRDLYLMAGVYEGVLRLRDGMRIVGGYDAAWVRGPRTEAEHRTVLLGTFDAEEGQYLTVVARDLVVAPTLQNLVIEGADAEMDGHSSYAVHVQDSVGLTILRSTIQQGDGAPGASGEPGDDAVFVAATPGMAGGLGGDGDVYITICDDFSFGAGGEAGTNVCNDSPSVADPLGGAGGAGGEMDAACVIIVGTCDDCTAVPGDPGDDATQFAAMEYGARGASGATCDALAPTAGLDGRVRNGVGGTGAVASRGSVVEGYWVGVAGGGGGTGENGGGGGGGGGAGGCDDDFGVLGGDDSYGGGGGGGGAGGCAARSGGGGGGAGGGSFGVFALRSAVTVSSVEFLLGEAGAGGAGGAGGQGQSGGPAGLGGMAAGTALAGADGGAGGHGGHGGGGGGGAGGLSFAIFELESTTTLEGAIYTGGAAGEAGAGGVSAPGTVGGAEHDGEDGTLGVAGERGEVFTCAAASGC